MSDPAPSSVPSLTPEEYEAQRAKEETTRRSSPPIGRQLPRSLEAEEYLISTCILDGNGTIAKAIDAGIRPESFYEPKHSLVWSRLMQMHVAKMPIDASTLAEELQTVGDLDRIGGFAFIAQVSSRIPTTANASYFISKVHEQAALREFIRCSNNGVEDAFNFSGELSEFLALQETRLRHVFKSSSKSDKGLTVWRPAEFRAWTPPMELNLLGAGYLRRRQITTLIGPPGVGKSRLSLWLGVSHICGREFLGLDPKGGKLKWLFVGNENDPERQKRDLEWFYKSLTAPEQKEVDERLFLHVLDSHEDSQLSLMDADAYRRIGATLKNVNPDVFVCDPWGNMIEGSESDDLIIRQTLKLLLRVVAENSPDSAILIIHHARTGKVNTMEAGNNYSGGSLGRGSKVLVSQARCELAMWPGDSEDASKLVLTCEKVNNAPKFEPIGINFDNGIYSVDFSFSVKAWRDDIEGRRSTKTLTISDVVACVKDGIVRYKDICVRLGETSEATVKRRLIEAVGKGYLKKTDPAGSYELGPAAFSKMPRPAASEKYEPEPPPASAADEDLFHQP